MSDSVPRSALRLWLSQVGRRGPVRSCVYERLIRLVETSLHRHCPVCDKLTVKSRKWTMDASDLLVRADGNTSTGPRNSHEICKSCNQALYFRDDGTHMGGAEAQGPLYYDYRIERIVRIKVVFELLPVDKLKAHWDKRINRLKRIYPESDEDDRVRKWAAIEERVRCQHTFTTVEVSYSDKNPNRHYHKCVDCRSFLGWVDE